MSDEQAAFTPNSIVNLILIGLAVLLLGVMGWVAMNSTDIPVIKAQLVTQGNDVNNIKTQISDVPVIKVQMDSIQKQLDRMSNSEDSTMRAVEDDRLKLMDHEQRIKSMESHFHR